MLLLTCIGISWLGETASRDGRTFSPASPCRNCLGGVMPSQLASIYETISHRSYYPPPYSSRCCALAVARKPSKLSTVKASAPLLVKHVIAESEGQRNINYVLLVH